MKVKPSVKPICEKCKVIRRKGRVMVIWQTPTLTWDDFWRKLLWHVLPALTCPARSGSR